uniref:Uncharacterized protein n=1 Tax=Arundo donax TaxID=35708 RepID=A0A0A9FCX1_ARUDO
MFGSSRRRLGWPSLDLGSQGSRSSSSRTRTTTSATARASCACASWPGDYCPVAVEPASWTASSRT